MTVATPKTLQMLYARTTLNAQTGCLEWQGFCKPYGWVWHNGKNRYAHRLAFELAHNIELARDDHVCHTCDNPSCINVDHLFLGDAQTNSQDAHAKGRHSHGEQHGNSKVTEDQVREIRALASSGVPQEEIARRFGIHQTTVSHIVIRRLWAWLP